MVGSMVSSMFLGCAWFSQSPAWSANIGKAFPSLLVNRVYNQMLPLVHWFQIFVVICHPGESTPKQVHLCTDSIGKLGLVDRASSYTCLVDLLSDVSLVKMSPRAFLGFYKICCG